MGSVRTQLNPLIRQYVLVFSLRHHASAYMERMCADTIGTVLVPWAGHF